MSAGASFRLRVYYEDTDLAGVVYYANYLRFLERARTEALLAVGIDQALLRRELGVVFAVRRVAIDYLAPARFQDMLDVTTAVVEIGGARIDLLQTVLRDGSPLARAEVTVVGIGDDGRPSRISAEIRDALTVLNLDGNSAEGSQSGKRP